MDGNAAQGALDNLAFVLLNVLALQALGYYLKSSGMMSIHEQRGIGLFVGTLALPALFFKSLATMNVWLVDGVVLGSAAISKFLLISITSALGFAIKRFTTPLPGDSELRGGILGLVRVPHGELRPHSVKVVSIASRPRSSLQTATRSASAFLRSAHSFHQRLSVWSSCLRACRRC